MTKVSIFCGAARGLGRAVANYFLDSGWTVIILDLYFEERSNSCLHLIECDVSDFKNTKKHIEDIFQRFCTIDALVNCVRYRSQKGEKLDIDDEWERGMSIGLNTYFNASSIVCELSKVKGSGCSIINISSVLSGLINLNESISYHSAKAAINQMTRFLAIKYGPYNIRANVVAPGLISNQSAEKASEDPSASLYAKYAQHVPLKRSGTPEEVAALVLFLASHQSTFITAQTITIDGGLSNAEHLGIISSWISSP